MNIAEIQAALSALKYVVPAVDAATAAAKVKAQIPADKADLLATVAAVEKNIADLKGGIEAVQTAVLAALNPTAPAE